MKKIGFYMYIVIFSSESTKEKSQECKSRSKRGSINEMGNIKLRDFELTFALLGWKYGRKLNVRWDRN